MAMDGADVEAGRYACDMHVICINKRAWKRKMPRHNFVRSTRYGIRIYRINMDKICNENGVNYSVRKTIDFFFLFPFFLFPSPFFPTRHGCITCLPHRAVPICLN